MINLLIIGGSDAGISAALRAREVDGTADVTALFKLSAVFTIVWAWLFLGEGNIRQRVLGTLVILAGGALIAV